MAVKIVDTKVSRTKLQQLAERLRDAGMDGVAAKVEAAGSSSEAVMVVREAGMSDRAIAAAMGVDVSVITQVSENMTGTADIDAISALIDEARRKALGFPFGTFDAHIRNLENQKTLNGAMVAASEFLAVPNVAKVTGRSEMQVAAAKPSGSSAPFEAPFRLPFEQFTGGLGATPDPQTGLVPSGSVTAGQQIMGADGNPILDWQTGQPFFERGDGSRYTVDANGNPIELTMIQNQWVDANLPELPDYIGGFPETYKPAFDGPRGLGPDPGATGRTVAPPTAPRYRVGDEWGQFAAMSPEYIATVQGAMARAGLIDEEDITDIWTIKAAQAMEQTMLIANARGGDTWVNVLRQLEQEAPTEEDKANALRQANPFIAPVFRAPDKATLKQGVRAEFSRKLGREVKDWEFGLFIDQMSSDFKRQHSAEIAAARSSYEAEINARATGATSGGGGSVQQVDPMARMAERFLSLYTPEIDAETAEDERQLNTVNLQRSLAGIERAVGI